MNVLIMNLIMKLCAILIFPLIIFLIFRHQILSFFKPNNYCYIEMIERDNNCINWLQKKEKDLQFKFNDGLYNMFQVVSINDNKISPDDNLPYPPKIIKVFSTIYKKGRLSKLFYKEGESNPLDIRNLRIVNDAQQSNQIEKIQISRLINSGQSIANEIWQKYGLFMIIAIILLLLFLVFKGNGGG